MGHSVEDVGRLIMKYFLACVLCISASAEDRLRYPLSVFPGGIQGIDFQREKLSDPALMRAWGGVGELSPATLRSGMYYLQYRRGDQVGWTSEPRFILAGERVMVDQSGSILRLRCGNGISAAPKLPLVTFAVPLDEAHELALAHKIRPSLAIYEEPSLRASADNPILFPPQDEPARPLPVDKIGDGMIPIVPLVVIPRRRHHERFVSVPLVVTPEPGRGVMILTGLVGALGIFWKKRKP